MRGLAVVWAATFLAITPSAGAEFGTREEAIAMVKRVQAEFAKVGAEQTFADVNDKSNPSFHDRDLYPFIRSSTISTGLTSRTARGRPWSART